jgi:hypothetical protein
MIPEVAHWIWLNETLPPWASANIDSLLHYEFFLAPCQPTGHIQPHLACGLMGSVPHSRSALRILEACRKRAELPEPPRRITYGPDLLTSLFAEDRGGLTALPLHYFYAIPDRDTTHAFWHAGDLQRAEILKRFESTFTDDEPPYAVHLWGVEGSSQRRVPGEYAESIPSRPI